MSSSQWAEWQTYGELEPFGSPRDDLRAGVVAVAAVAPWTTSSQRLPRPEDLFPVLKDADQVKTLDDEIDAVEKLADLAYKQHKG